MWPGYLLCHHRVGTGFPVSCFFGRIHPTSQGRLICSPKSNRILYPSQILVQVLFSLKGRILLVTLLLAEFLTGPLNTHKDSSLQHLNRASPDSLEIPGLTPESWVVADGSKASESPEGMAPMSVGETHSWGYCKGVKGQHTCWMLCVCIFVCLCDGKRECSRVERKRQKGRGEKKEGEWKWGTRDLRTGLYLLPSMKSVCQGHSDTVRGTLSLPAGFHW